MCMYVWCLSAYSWLLHGCCMVVAWLLRGCCMVVAWLLRGCCVVVAWLLQTLVRYLSVFHVDDGVHKALVLCMVGVALLMPIHVRISVGGLPCRALPPLSTLRMRAPSHTHLHIKHLLHWAVVEMAGSWRLAA